MCYFLKQYFRRQCYPCPDYRWDRSVLTITWSEFKQNLFDLIKTLGWIAYIFGLQWLLLVNSYLFVQVYGPINFLRYQNSFWLFLFCIFFSISCIPRNFGEVTPQAGRIVKLHKSHWQPKISKENKPSYIIKRSFKIWRFLAWNNNPRVKRSNSVDILSCS